MRKKIIYYLGIMMVCGTLMIGCSNKSNNQKDNQIETESNSAGSQSITQGNTGFGNMDNSGDISDSKVVVDKDFSARDLDIGYEESTSIKIHVSDSKIDISGDVNTQLISESNGIITIKGEGEYILTGTLSSGQIIINANKTDKIHLVLNGVSIKNPSGAAIYVRTADKVFITTTDNSENTLEDGITYVQIDDNTVDGVIFSKSDLTLNGEGNLTIIGNYKHGIVSKDELAIASGTYVINAVKDGLNSKEGIKIKDGNYTIISKEGNGLQSKNGEDETQGYVYIEGGNIQIPNSVEGIEGTAIVIAGGEIAITASDDGLNSAVGSVDETTTETTTGMNGMFGDRENPFQVDSNCFIQITGGKITIDAGGDGIDSNGHVVISGGEVYVNGPTNSGNGAFDYNGTAKITGGTVVLVGSSGMAQGFSSSSTQYSILYNFSTNIAGGTPLIVTDSTGKEILKITPSKNYQSIVYSSELLKKDEVYTFTSGNLSESITLTDIVTSNGNTGGMGGFGIGGQRGGNKMERPADGKMPEGFEPPVNGEMPEGFEPPVNGEMQEGFEPPVNGEMPEGFEPPVNGQMPQDTEPSTTDDNGSGSTS